MDSQGGNKLPPVNEILIVLQGANQNHGVTDKRVIEAFEQYLDDGHTTMDLFNELMELFDESGFSARKEEGQDQYGIGRSNSRFSGNDRRRIDVTRTI